MAIRKGFLIKRGDGVFENIVEVTVKSSLLFIIWPLSDFKRPFLIKGRRKSSFAAKLISVVENGKNYFISMGGEGGEYSLTKQNI